MSKKQHIQYKTNNIYNKKLFLKIAIKILFLWNFEQKYLSKIRKFLFFFYMNKRQITYNKGNLF